MKSKHTFARGTYMIISFFLSKPLKPTLHSAGITAMSISTNNDDDS